MIGDERDQFAQSILADKEYAEALRDANINTSIADQIRGLREARGWTQKELGSRALDNNGKPIQQERISELEDPDYGRCSLTTLKRLASAFDVNLVVRFSPFSELADWLADLPSDRLTVPSRVDDPGLRRSTSTDQFTEVSNVKTAITSAEIFLIDGTKLRNTWLSPSLLNISNYQSRISDIPDMGVSPVGTGLLSSVRNGTDG